MSEPQAQTAAQRQEQQKTLEAALTLAIQQMNLRKWCVEQAAEIAKTALSNPAAPPYFAAPLFKADDTSIDDKIMARTQPVILSKVEETPPLVDLVKGLTEYFYDFVTQPALELAQAGAEPIPRTDTPGFTR